MATKLFSIEGKNCLITGGTAGMGLATVKRLTVAGANVVMSGRRDAQALADEIGCHFIRCDVSDETQLKSLFEQAELKLGKLDFVFNNAGMDDNLKMLVEEGSEWFKQVLNVNLIAVYNGIKFAAEHMKDGGSILSTASISALHCHPGDSRYAPSKAGVVSLTKCAAIELAPRNIRVNCISPGGIKTEMLHPDHEIYSFITKVTPLNRIGEPEEIAALAHFLATDDASYITGQDIAVDGGLTCGLAIHTIGALVA